MGNDREHLPPVQVHHPADGAVDTKKSVDQLDREAAWKEVEAFAGTGKGKAKDLPLLIRRTQWPEGVRGKMPAIAKRIDGDLALECARMLGLSVIWELSIAYQAKSEPSKPALLRRLHAASAYELAHLGSDPFFDKLKNHFKTEPFSVVFPQLADNLRVLETNKEMLKWYVTATDSTIAGMQLAYVGTKELAQTLDAIDAWAWLDDFRLAGSRRFGDGIVTFRDNTKHTVAKPKLEALAKKYEPDFDKQQAAIPGAQTELATQMTGTDDKAMLEAAALTQGSSRVSQPTAEKRLAGASPDTVLEYCMATDQSVEDGVALLDGAKGARLEHMRDFLRDKIATDVALALKKDSVRAIVRKHIGRDASLRGLFPRTVAEEIHPIVIADTALRRWVYEDGHPETLLWLAAGSGPGSAEGTQLVKREKTNGWVKKLMPGADEIALRRFVLNSTDNSAKAHVREHLLHDPPERTVDPELNEVVPIDDTAYGTRAKLHLDIAVVGHDPAAILERLADLDDTQRMEVLKDAKAMKQLLDNVFEASLLRAMFLLRPTLMKLVTLPFARDQAFPILLSYMQSRPPDEGFVVAKNQDSVKAARRLVGPGHSPFDVFPSIRDDRRLAKALANNDELFEWIMEETEPSYAMQMLAREATRQIAANMMSERQTLTDNLPEHDSMLSEGKTGYKIIHERLDKHAKKDSDEYLAGEARFMDSTVDRRAQDLKQASKAKLWDGIEELATSNGDKQSFLTLARRAPADQKVALFDGTHDTAVRLLRVNTKLKPQQIFFELSADQLFALPSAADWLYLSEDPTVILAMLQHQKKAVRSVAKHIDSEPEYVARFPRGAALMPHERVVLDEIANHVTTVAALQALFGARFDVAVENFDLAETRKLWKVVARLPPSQFNQNAVKKVIEKNIGPVGQWADPNIELDSDASRFERPDHGYDAGQQMTLDEVKRLYGMSEQDVHAASDPETGWLVENQGKYAVKQIEIEQFDSTVLHEIGHSIDTILGKRTDLVFGIGGWKEYGIGQFEQWAGDMNGFDGLDPAHKPQVVDAWKQALMTGRDVKKLVDDKHPALTGNASTPLVDAAKRESLFRFTEPDKVTYADRVCITNGQQLFSMPKDTYLGAPSQYGLSAPAEYFAECYVEFYRQYDGTKATDHKKGGRLPGWIKDWFRANVDQIRLNPKRVRPQP